MSAASPTRLLAVALPELPEVTAGDDLGRLVAEAWWRLTVTDPELAPRPDDVLVVTQKVVSKAEGRIVRLADVEPRPEAVDFARRLGQGPAAGRGRAPRVGRRSCAWSAASSSAVPGTASSAPTPAWMPPTSAQADVVTLLPEDPDRSAAPIRERIDEELGVLVQCRRQRLVRAALALGHHRRRPRRGRLPAPRRPARHGRRATAASCTPPSWPWPTSWPRSRSWPRARRAGGRSSSSAARSCRGAMARSFVTSSWPPRTTSSLEPGVSGRFGNDSSRPVAI